VILAQESTELEQQIQSVIGDINAKQAELRTTRGELDSSNELTDAEKATKSGKIAELKMTIDGKQKELAWLDKKKEMLNIRSPIDGKVVTSDVDLKLGSNRPVKSGEQLLEIADPSKDWELEVLMPEKRMGHLAKARSQTKGKLPVTFFLATNPADQMQGQVEMDELSAEVRGDSGNTVLVRVSFDQKELRRIIENPKIGAGATAKIHCGKRPIGYVWFHDVVDFIRSKILFRIM
jgi:hypothetical protein